MTTRLRLGTRSSALARWQAHWVADRLSSDDLSVELIPMTTHGDTADRESLVQIGSPGVFVKELERALLNGQIDLAVHSLKDLPTDVPSGLHLAAVCERADVHDVLISRKNDSLTELAQRAIIGTGSLRRRAQLLHRRPDLQMRDIRGNVDTRLEKLAAGQYDAIVLAQAGLERLGLAERISEVFDFRVAMPAVGQGALGIETRADDAETRAAITRLDHKPTHQAVIAERKLLAELSGGCLAPIGAYARAAAAGGLRLDAVVLSSDGRTRLEAGATSSPNECEQLGALVARQLLSQGAAELISQSRQA